MLGSMSEQGCDYQLVIGGGAATFAVVNCLTGRLVPAVACQTEQQKWKWRNVATSLVHSVITGVWAVIAFYQVSYPGYWVATMYLYV